MFTGIVEGVGSIARIERAGERVDLEVSLPPQLGEGLRVGDSVALDGCCLTATRVEDARVGFQAVAETLSRTALADRRVGDAVNLERALRADARLDGHIVQGHVDATGVVKDLRRDGDDVRMCVSCGAEFARLLVEKGSVAIDGVSLTVVDAGSDRFTVALIPHTLAVTTLGRRREGDRVNLEADVLGKYVLRYLERIAPG